MKRDLLIAVAAITLAACGGGESDRAPADPAAGSAGDPAMASAASAEGFLMRSALIDLYAIQSSRLAVERTRSADVRRFAEQMIEQHGRLANEAQAAARAQGLRFTPPTQLDVRRREMVQQLRDAGAAEFDARYVDQQREAHENGFSLLRDYAANGDNPALKDWARRTTPAVERQMQTARALGRANPSAGPAGG